MNHRSRPSVSTVMDKHLKYRASLVAALAGGGLLLAACGGGGSSGGSTASVGAGSSSGGGAYGTNATTTTAVHSGPLGRYVTSANGRTVYIFSADTSSMSACHGACTHEWPAVMSGGHQVVFKGHPIYYFAGDKAPGAMNGEGLDDFGGTWTVVSPTGRAIAASSGHMSPSPSGSGGSSQGWG